MAETIKTRAAPRAGATALSDASLTQDAERLGRSLLDEGAELGAAMLAIVQDNATAFYREQRDRAASEIGAVGEFLHNSVRSMQHQEAVVARCADEAAAQIEGFADWLRRRSWSELTSDFEELARRYPMSFMAAAAGSGFLAVRLLTAPQRMDEQSQSAVMRPASDTASPRAAMPAEAEVVAGVSGGAAVEHDAGASGED
jgi:hypothetical protein